MPGSISIGNVRIGNGAPPLIVAEISANHDQSLDKALELIRAAAKSGVGAVKLQTYTADTMTLDIHREGFVIQDKNSLWHNESLYSLYQKAHTPWDWHAPIFNLAKQLGMVCFSTPFDTTAVDFLESLDVPCYKIASFENTDVELIKRVAQTRKPVIMSTGLASRLELDQSVQYLRQLGCTGLVLLKCTSQYPALPSAINLATIADMKERYQCIVGLSDHTLGLGVSLAAVSHGAAVIEKHFTLSRKQGGVDAPFSMEPSEMQQLVQESRVAWQAQGEIFYGATEAEAQSRIFRRSLYLVDDIRKGDRVTKENVRAIRPGMGLSPLVYPKVLGGIFNKDFKKGTPLKWEMLMVKEEGESN